MSDDAATERRPNLGVVEYKGERRVVVQGRLVPKHYDWKGRTKSDKVDADGFYDVDGPIAREGVYYIKAARFQTPLNREGTLFSHDGLTVFGCWIGWAVNTEKYLMNVIEELQTNLDEASRLWEAYRSKLVTFRSVVKNDVDSLQAAARKTTDSVVRINKAYADVFATLTGPDMQKAIDNAERLARALDAIAHLESHKLTFAVVDGHRGE